MIERGLSDSLARGNREALGALFELHANRVLAVALKLLRDRTEAEDVLQETFLEAWRTATRYDAARGDVASWLVTIARSRSVDRLRSRSAALRAAERELAEPVAVVSANADVQLDDARHLQALRLQLAQLPVEQQKMLALAWNEGLSQSDIARKTGLPLGTVKTRTRMALSRLSTALAPH